MAKPPYGIIWNRLKNGKAIPFLGAGASLGGRAADEIWNGNQPKFLPSGKELAHFLADEAEYPSTEAIDLDDLAKVSSYYSEISGRTTLRERLRELMNHDYKVGLTHSFLASIPSSLLIVVTNYDTLLEQAFQEAGKPYDLVIHPTDRKDIANAVLWWPHNEKKPIFIEPNKLFVDLTKTTVIYKMHGTIMPNSEEWDNFVITEEDYVEFLSRMTTRTAVPAIFYEYFTERNFLFLGYSLRDWNLRVILKNLSKYIPIRDSAHHDNNAKLPSWAIQMNPSELERKLWEWRNISIFNLALDDFITELRGISGIK